MKYRNTKTGNVICVKCEIKGQNWECIDTPFSSSDTEKKPVKRKATKKDE